MSRLEVITARIMPQMAADCKGVLMEKIEGGKIKKGLL
jgi:hypothetical protein